MPINTEPFETPDGRIENIALNSGDTSQVWFRIDGVPCWMDRDEFSAFRSYVEAGGTPEVWFRYKPETDRIKGQFDPDERNVHVHVNGPRESDIDGDDSVASLKVTDAPPVISDAIGLPDDYTPYAD